MPGVTIRGLTMRYGDVAAVEALDLDVAPGELVALLGPSGCGKTTTLRLVAGFLEPEAGEIRVGDRLLSSPSGVVPPEGRKMAMIFQSYALWPHMTVAGNVAYGLRFGKHLDRADRDRRVRDILRAVQLAGYESRYPGELSGGQQQRVAVARALVVEPEILLLDEPLSNLDANLREEMRFEIRRLHEAFGITTLYVTHDQAEAMVISDRIAVLERGRVAQVGTAEDLFERPATRFVAQFIGRTNLIDGVVTEPGIVAVQGEPRAGGEPSPSMIAAVRGEPRAGGEPSPSMIVAAHDGLRLRVATSDAKPGASVAVSIRPHAITLSADGPGGRRTEDNVLSGVVKRSSYLGAGVDYEVDVAGVVLRVAAPAGSRIAHGTPVTLVIPIARCLPLPAA